jgi:hypothetical protein
MQELLESVTVVCEQECESLCVCRPGKQATLRCMYMCMYMIVPPSRTDVLYTCMLPAFACLPVAPSLTPGWCRDAGESLRLSDTDSSVHCRARGGFQHLTSSSSVSRCVFYATVLISFLSVSTYRVHRVRVLKGLTGIHWYRFERRAGRFSRSSSITDWGRSATSIARTATNDHSSLPLPRPLPPQGSGSDGAPRVAPKTGESRRA